MTPKREEVELLRHSNDLRSKGVLMRQAYNAVKSGDWAKYLEIFLKKRQAQRMDKCESERAATTRWSKKRRAD